MTTQTLAMLLSAFLPQVSSHGLGSQVSLHVVLAELASKLVPELQLSVGHSSTLSVRVAASRWHGV